MRTPALPPWVRAFAFRSEESLADALAKDTDPLIGRLAAGMILAARGS